MPIFKIEVFRKISADTPSEPHVENNKFSFEQIAFWALALGMFLLPLFFIPFFSVSIDSTKILFLSIVVVTSFFIWLLARLKNGTFTIPKNLLLVAGVVIVGVFALSSLLSVAVSTSISGLAYDLGTFASILTLFVLMFLASIVFQSQKRMLYLYGIFFLIFIFLFLFHFLRLIFGADFLSLGVFNSGVSSLIGKWNDLGIFGGMIILLSLISLEFLELSKKYRLVLYGFLISSLAVLSIVNFTLSWFILGIFAVILIVYKLSFPHGVKKDGERGLPRFSLPPTIVLLVSFLFIISGNSLGGAIAGFLNVSQVEVRPSWGATVDITKNTWGNNILLGSGPNRFTNQWLAFKPDGINTSLFWDTDFRSGVGLIPTFVVTTGLLGLLAWFFFFGTFLYRGIHSLFTSSNPLSYYLSLSSFLLALYLWIISIFYVPSITLFAFAFLLTGVFIASLISRGLIKNFVFSYTKDQRVGFVAVLISITLLIGTATSGYGVLQRFFSLLYFNSSRIAFNSEGNFDKAALHIQKAINLNDSDIFYQALTEIEIVKLGVVVNRQDLTPDNARAQFQDTLARAIGAGRNAVAKDETNYANWLSLGRVYAAVVPLDISGAYESARVSIESAQALNPKSPRLLLDRARLEVARGETSEARNYITQALNEKNNYTDAIFLLAQLDINDGNVEGAIASVETATLLDPNNTGLFFQLGLLRYNTGDFIGAISALERAVFLNTDYSNARYFLGLSYYNTNRSADAVVQFEDIERLNPENQEVKNILNNLQNGRNPFENLPAPEVLDTAPIEE